MSEIEFRTSTTGLGPEQRRKVLFVNVSARDESKLKKAAYADGFLVVYEGADDPDLIVIGGHGPNFATSRPAKPFDVMTVHEFANAILERREPRGSDATRPLLMIDALAAFEDPPENGASKAQKTALRLLFARAHRDRPALYRLSKAEASSLISAMRAELGEPDDFDQV